ncbi:MAG: hypothetical protein V8R91_20730 [Butyricimonas faecihominis]
MNIAYIDAMITGLITGKFVFNNTVIKDLYLTGSQNLSVTKLTTSMASL